MSDVSESHRGCSSRRDFFKSSLTVWGARHEIVALAGALVTDSVVRWTIPPLASRL